MGLISRVSSRTYRKNYKNMANPVLFEDIFDVKDIDPDGKKFDRVSRILGDSESYKMDLILDVAVNLYPMKLSDKFRLVLTDTLQTDGSVPITGEEDEWNPRWDMKSNRASDYDYVMYGLVYKIDDDESGTRLAVYISFGGLLMRLQGDAQNLGAIKQDRNLYLMMKKIMAS